MTYQPEAILDVGGIQGASTTPLVLYQGGTQHAETLGGAVGSHSVNSRSAGGLSSDYSQFRYARAGVTKYRHGVNLDGSGNDHWSLRRESYAGDGTEREFLKFDRLTGRADFYGPIYSAGTLVSGGVPITGGTMTGKLVIGIGAISTSTSTENPVSPSTWITNLGNRSPLTLYGPNGTIACFANTDGTDPQSPSGKIRYGTMGVGADNGFHMDQNLAYFPSGVSPKLFDPTLPRGNVGFDHDGTFSYSWDPAAVAGTGYDFRAGLGDRSNNPYVPQSNQSFVIYGQGVIDGAGSTDYGKVCLATMRAGQTMRFMTSNSPAAPYAAMEITAHIAPGPGNVNIFRQAVLGGVNGIANIRLMSVGSVSGAADGSIWYDGSNFRGRIGGVDKTFTLT